MTGATVGIFSTPFELIKGKNKKKFTIKNI